MTRSRELSDLPVLIPTSSGNIELDPSGSNKVIFKGNATKGAGQFQLNCENNSHGIVIKGPPHSASASYTLTLPNNDGDADQFLQTNGSGTLTWAAAGGGGGTTVHANQAAMTGQSTPATGSLHYVTGETKLYMYTGSGYYVLATITNATPVISDITQSTGGGSSASIGAGATFTLTAGSNTVVTVAASDSDVGQSVTHSATLTSGTLSDVLQSFTQGSGGSTNVYTLVPATSGGGTLTYRFDVTDGTATAQRLASFTIAFSQALQNVTGYEITHTANGNQNYTLWTACLFDDSGNAPFESSTLRGDTTHASGSIYQTFNGDAFTEYNYAITNYTGGDSPPSGTSRYMNQYVNWSANNVTVSTTWTNSNAIDLKLFYLTGEAYENNNVGWDGGSVKFYINGVKEANARTLTALPAAADGNSNAHGYYIAFV
tara:strand:- start:4031 stop:5323 length:1293 start_codon:yes stop_codon:yes gene_type:complete